jgi:hypothetical protein
MSVPFLNPGLFENTVESPRREIMAWVSGNRNAPILDRVLELPVASFLIDQIPAVIHQHFEHFPDLHFTILTTFC